MQSVTRHNVVQKSESTRDNSFGGLLKGFRQAKKVSQQELAQFAEVSTRHVSFLETGRARPSREMVLILGSALDLALRDRNTLLGAAGFAAAYRETELHDGAMSAVTRALDHILKHHDPYPAVVVNGSWDVVRMNNGALLVFGALFDGHAPPTNLVRVLLDPIVRAKIVNFEQIAMSISQRLHREAAMAPVGSSLRDLVQEVAKRSDLPNCWHTVTTRPLDVVLPVHVRLSTCELRFFTTITTLGTPLDVTAEEIRIESYFPMDSTTDNWVRGLNS